MLLPEAQGALAEASTAQELFAEAADLSLHSEIRIVGSVARAAMMGVELDNHRPSGILRDIDLIRLGDRGGLPQVKSGRDLDVNFERWITADGSKLVFPRDPSLRVEVKYPEVFDPYEAKINGFTIRTLHPDVLGRINTMQLVQRPKDKVSAASYDSFLNGQSDRMDPELLKPFDAMHAALSRRYAYRAKGTVRGIYHELVPEATRKRVHITRRIPALGVKPSSTSSAG